jgi:hypothetical protein
MTASMRTYSIVLPSLLVLQLGCGVEPDLGGRPEVEDGLVIASADEHRITGTYGEHGHGLEFTLVFDATARFAIVGACGETWLSSVFVEQSAATTIFERLTFVRTDMGLQTLGDQTALAELAEQPEAELVVPLQAALRAHGIVDEIVTLP